MLMPSVFTDNFFDNFFEDFNRPAPKRAPRNEAVLMRTDIKETAEGYELDMDLPGYSKSDITAQLKEGYLTVTASSNKEDEHEDEAGYIRKERYSGTCRRSFYVGDVVTEEDIQAKFDNGVLHLYIPKIEKKPEVEQEKFIAIEG